MIAELHITQAQAQNGNIRMTSKKLKIMAPHKVVTHKICTYIHCRKPLTHNDQ